VSDELLDPRPVARKPRPRFGLHSIEPESEPAKPKGKLKSPIPPVTLNLQPQVLKVGSRVEYIGSSSIKKLIATVPDLGVVQDGPKTAKELNIPPIPQIDPNSKFYDVSYINRLGNTRVWTWESSLKELP
jgi:hypothetical protein